MKASSIRRVRRRAATSRDTGIFKKDNQEQSFFGTASHEGFFQPAPAVQRKQDPVKEEEKVQRAEDKKEEEKIQRAEDRKEEQVQRAEDKKEEEQVQRAEDKKEEQTVQRAEDKKEEGQVQRAGDSKEEEKVQKKESAPAAREGSKTSNYIQNINGKGQPLPADTQNFYSERMGQDFSDVKIHTSKEAADSATDINAKAYTYGNNIVFNEGKYDTSSHEGKKLLAHELTHVMQQSGTDKGNIQRQVDELPNLSQGAYDSCGAASLIAAIMIYDRQRGGAVPDNTGFVSATNIVLSYYSMHQASIISGLETRRRLDHDTANDLYWELRRLLLQIRNDSRVPGAAIAEADYQHLAAAIYALHVSNTSGLSQAAISNIMSMLGMAGQSHGGLESYGAIISHPSITGLVPGQIAQVGWYVRVGATGVNLHAFLIGRLNNGEWFLYDQGPNPPKRFRAWSLAELDGIIRGAAATGTYWLFTGATSDFRILPIGWTGINVLGSAAGVPAVSTSFLSPGDKLAEIDAGAFTFGSGVNVVAFHSEYYDQSAALSAAAGLSGNGGAIIEMPSGRYLLYTTTLVSDANRTQTSLDASGGGNFAGAHRYFHAWLQLRSPGGLGSLISVY